MTDKRALGLGGPKPGVPALKKQRSALEAVRDIIQELTGKDLGPDADLKMFMELLINGDLTNESRLSGWTALMKYTRAQLKAVEHSGTVTEVQVQLSPDDIKGIIAADPFKSAIEVKSEP